MDILHARVELALFQEVQGSATESFAREGRELLHGNQILAGHALGYEPNQRFRQSDHTLANIFLALERVFLSPDRARRAKEQLAETIWCWMPWSAIPTGITRIGASCASARKAAGW